MVSSVSVLQARKNGRINGSLDLLVSQNGVFHRQSLNLLSKGQIPKLRHLKRSQFESVPSFQDELDYELANI